MRRPGRSGCAPRLPGRDMLATDRDGHLPRPEAALSAVHYVLVWKPLQETLDRLPRAPCDLLARRRRRPHLRASPPPRRAVRRIVDPDLTRRMTEYVVWQCLDHLRLGATYRRQQREHRWRDVEPPAAREVTVGIMGLGVMGKDAAAALLRLGFSVRGWARDAEDARRASRLSPARAGSTPSLPAPTSWSRCCRSRRRRAHLVDLRS